MENERLRTALCLSLPVVAPVVADLLLFCAAVIDRAVPARLFPPPLNLILMWGSVGLAAAGAATSGLLLRGGAVLRVLVAMLLAPVGILLFALLFLALSVIF
jgi:hypothetical protein